MLRALPVSVGLILFFGFPGTLGPSQAVAAVKQRARKMNAPETSSRSRKAEKTVDSATKKKHSTATKSAASKSSRKIPAEVKLKPASTPVLPEPAPAPSTAAAPPPTRGPTRMDFDDRLIQGQTNKSGAVYLYDRKELKTASMIKKRESFRDEILATVYGN